MKTRMRIGGLGWVVKTMACGAALVALSFAGATVAQAKPNGGGGCTGEYESVTSGIANYDSSSQAYYLQSDQLSALEGEYDNGVDGVCSYLWKSHTTSGWELKLSNSTRSVTITLNNPYPGTNPRGTLTVTAKLEDQCFTAVNVIQMRNGDSAQCPVIISQIPTGQAGATYSLVMDGGTQFTAEPIATSLVQVSCTSDDGTSCNHWVYTPIPNGDAAGEAIARLTETVNTHKSTMTNWLGDFYLTFQIDVTRP